MNRREDGRLHPSRIGGPGASPGGRLEWGGAGGRWANPNPCWFEAGSKAMPAATNTFLSWSVLTDGVAAGTDVVVQGGDDTVLEVVTPGMYLVTAQAGAFTGTATEVVTSRVVLNGDAQGPAYYYQSMALATGNEFCPMLSFPLRLVQGDELQLRVFCDLAATCLGGYATLLRIA